MSSPERQILDEVSASVALVECTDTRVCHQKRMPWSLITLASACRSSGESRIIMQHDEFKGLLQLT